MAGMGYHVGVTGKRRWLAASVLVLAFSIVMWLIADLDHPMGGFLRVNQQTMIDLRDGLSAEQGKE